MSSYKLEMRLPSCSVTTDIIAQIENYIFQRAIDTFELSDDQVHDKYSVKISESIGKESLDSVSSMRGTRFADTTESVTLSFIEYVPRREISVHLNRTSFLSRIEIEIERSDAREVATGLRDGILGIIEPNKSFGWFFHPHAAVSGALSVLFPVLLITLVVVAWKTESNAVAAVSLIVTMIVLAYQVCQGLTDYTEFDSCRADIRKKVRGWVVSGVATFLVFGSLLSGFRNLVFGA